MQDILAWLNDHPALFALFIVLARIVDVSMGTVRTIMVVKGYRALAAMLGALEVVVWICAVSGVLKEITILKVAAYATGFALGNIVGIALEQKLALGHQVVTLVGPGRAHSVAFALRLAGYIVTQVPARGGTGRVAMCFVIVSRRRAQHVIRIARDADHNVFVTVQDVRVSAVSPTSPRNVPSPGWRGLVRK